MPDVQISVDEPQGGSGFRVAFGVDFSVTGPGDLRPGHEIFHVELQFSESLGFHLVQVTDNTEATGRGCKDQFRL